MRILVTGGAGFIGSHTVDKLINKGYKVKILDSLEKPVHMKGRPDYIPEQAEFILGDVRDKKIMEKALENVDFVMHFAAYQDYLPDFSKFFHVNSVGTALIYEIIAEKDLPIKKVVVASSQAVMGEGKYECKEHGIFCPDIRPEEQLQKGQWDIKCPVCEKKAIYQLSDESVINPQNQYAMSKYTQEMIAINLGKRYKIPSVALRYSIVQGPRQSFYNAYSGACRIFCLNMYFDKRPIVYEDGRSIRDYVNVKDVIDANMLALEKDEANYEVFNVGGGKPYTVLEFAEIVAKAFKKPIKPNVTGEYRFGDTRHIISDITKMKELGWQPKVSIEQSVENYIKYLKERTDINDILEYCDSRMRRLGVVRQAKK